MSTKMGENSEIDLYADDLGEEFSQENEYNESGLDLYDDVITPSANIKRADDEEYGIPEGNGTAHHVNSNDGAGDGVLSGGGPPQKKIGLYVGNLSWWTTDQDVMDAVYDLGVNDIFEVKFFENRANGQSKGFCVITLGSDASVRTVIEKLPKSEIHGQNPVVTPCNRQNLNHFEMQSRKTAPGGVGGGPQHVGGQPNFNQRGPPQPPGMRPPLIQRPVRPNGPLIPGQPRMGMPHQGMPPFGGGQPQWGPGMPPNAPPRPPAPMHPGAPPMANMPLMRMPPPQQPRGPIPQQPLLRGPSTQNDPRSQMQHPGGPMPPEWAQDGHPQHPHGPPGPQQMVMTQPGQPQPNQVMPPRVPQNEFAGPVPGMPPVAPHSGPAPHINPSFFQAQHHSALPPQQQTDQFGNRLPPGPVQYGHGDYRGPVQAMEMPVQMQISEQEFEEIMAKNKNVSSSAIARAVNDASSGDFPQAIETLVTAISLIKQSKVANDERCKILISSLQDTLHGIETKSYSNPSSRKDRPRSRDRSHERSSRREKSRRDRSRSRERDYRDRSRDRYHDDRHYESDRYRDKDRDRERDHRSSRH